VQFLLLTFLAFHSFYIIGEIITVDNKGALNIMIAGRAYQVENKVHPHSEWYEKRNEVKK